MGSTQEPCLTSDRNALRAWVSVSSSFRLMNAESLVCRKEGGVCGGNLRGFPSAFFIKAAAGGRFAAQIESAPKRNTTRVGGVSFCHVLTEKMQNLLLL